MKLPTILLVALVLTACGPSEAEQRERIVHDETVAAQMRDFHMTREAAEAQYKRVNTPVDTSKLSDERARELDARYAGHLEHEHSETCRQDPGLNSCS